MKFYDKVKIKVEGWRWWNGAVAWRREKFIPFWWPAWWDGGKWGDVILKASKDENTLIYYRYKKEFKAPSWEHWKWHDMYGKSAEDLILKVPVWTVVKDAKTGKILFQFTKDWQEFVVAKGWRWWLGNIHFKTPVRQFPQFALLGEPGEKKELILELQMLADVALIWTPSVWKSTLINAVSNVKAKVADYPFTTLIPNLGIVKWKNCNFSMIDIPGLIKGASEGKGLGFDFLRHVLKAKIWIFMLDVSRFEEGIQEVIDLLNEVEVYLKYKFLEEEKNIFWKPLSDLKIVYSCDDGLIKLTLIWIFEDNEEKVIFEKIILFIFNKIDTIQDSEILQELQSSFVEHISRKLWLSKNCIEDNIIKISAAWRINIEEFLNRVTQILDNVKLENIFESLFEKVKVDYQRQERYIKDVTDKELKKLIEEQYIEEDQAKYIKVWEVFDPYLNYLVFVLPWWNDEAELWFWEELEKKWILKWLQSFWVRKGDILKIRSPYGDEEVRYILV